MGIGNIFSKKKSLAAEIVSLKGEMSKLKEVLDYEKASNAFAIDLETQSGLDGVIPGVSYGALLQLYKKSAWVRSCVDVIKRASIAKGFSLATAEGLTDEVKIPKEVRDFFMFPNEEQTMEEVIGDVIIDLNIFGDAYLEVVRGKENRKPKELHNLYAPYMRVVINKKGKILGYKMISSYGTTVDFKPDEVIHYRLNSPGNSVYGLSPLESLIIPLQTDLLAQAYNKRFFENNATPRGHLDLGNCSKAQLERNKRYWREQMQGVHNSHKTIITEGGAKFNAIGTPPKDMEFLDQRRFSRGEIIAVYGVPPLKLSVIENANRANSKEQDVTFKKETVLPLQRMISGKLNKVLMKDFGLPDVRFVFNPLDLRDELEIAKVEALYLDRNVLTVNEVRRRLGKGEVDWGDDMPNPDNTVVDPAEDDRSDDDKMRDDQAHSESSLELEELTDDISDDYVEFDLD